MPTSNELDQAPGPPSEGTSRWSALISSLVPGLSQFLALICLFQLGLLGGSWYYFRARPTTPSSTTIKPASEIGGIDTADELLREGSYDRALAVYQRWAGGTAAPARELLQYRMALCQEALGRWDPARAAYAASAQSPRLAAAAELGQSRVQLRQGEPAEAKKLLYRLVLRSASPALRDASLQGDIRYWLALALTLESWPQQALPLPGPPGASAGTNVGKLTADWTFDRALDWPANLQRPQEPAASKFLAVASCFPTPGLALANLALPALLGDSRYLKPAAAEATDVIEVQAQGLNPADFLVSAAKEGDVAQLLKLLAKQAGLKPELTLEAEKQLEGRRAQLLVASMPLRNVVQALVDPLGLTYRIDQQTVRFSTDAEAAAWDRMAAAQHTARHAGLACPQNPLTAAASVAVLFAQPAPLLAPDQSALVRRALRDALLVFPEHPLSPAAQLELANLEAAQGKMDEALALYAQVPSTSSLGVEANYRRGALLRQLRRARSALAAFYLAVDQAPVHELAALAWWQIGRLRLEEGAHQEAAQPLRSALSSSSSALPATEGVRSAAATLLAAAHLLNEDPSAARAVLSDNSDAVHQGPYAPAAVFLEALARYRAASNREDALREIEKLLPALRAIQEWSVLGAVGKFLVIQAYGELGMTAEMVEVYRNAVRARGEEHPRPGLLADMRVAIGEAFFAGGQGQAAKQWFEAAQQGRWSARARFRLAAIALQEYRSLPEQGKTEAAQAKLSDCLKLCDGLLQETPSQEGLVSAADRLSVLKLMGQAYVEEGKLLSQQGKTAEAADSFQRAADCFAGKQVRAAGQP